VTPVTAAVADEHGVANDVSVGEREQGERAVIVQVVGPGLDDGGRTDIFLEKEPLVLGDSAEEGVQPRQSSEVMGRTTTCVPSRSLISEDSG